MCITLVKNVALVLFVRLQTHPLQKVAYIVFLIKGMNYNCGSLVSNEKFQPVKSPVK